MKKQFVITLIALVVTIVILIILAVTSMAVIFNDNLLDTTVASTDMYKISDYIDKIEIARGAVLLQHKKEVPLNELITQIYSDGVVEQGAITLLDKYYAKMVTPEGYVFLISGDSVEYLGNNIDSILISSISLDKSELNIDIEKKDTLTATIVPSYAENKNVKWTSSNEQVANVSDDGQITALSDGQTTITVETLDGSGLSASCNVVVRSWSDVYTTTAKHNYVDSEGNSASIPKGFQVSLKKAESTVNGGLVIKNATDGNEFVWIPVNDISSYKREAFLASQPFDTSYPDRIRSTKSSSSIYFTETLPTDEKNSIINYGGFYMGRYEAGIDNFSSLNDNGGSATAPSNNWTGYSGGNLVIQKDKTVWTYITQKYANNISSNLYKKTNGDSVNSKLCSSYAWDTALRFIMNNGNPDYASNSVEGNYGNVDDFRLTGQTTPTNNIYDMGGNAWEWTSEVCSRSASPCVRRGGSCDEYAKDGETSSSGELKGYPAGSRYYSGDKIVLVRFGFRVTMFL